MKTLKTLGLLLSVMMSFSSCEFLFNQNSDVPRQAYYPLGLCFQDASGNSLAKGIGLEHWIPSDAPVEYATRGDVIPDLYTLDILVFEPHNNIEPYVIPNAFHRRLTTNTFWGSWHLTNDFPLSVDKYPDTKKIIYRLKCPYVFGDEEVREVVTYWTKTTKSGVNFNTECYRIEFEGNEYKITNTGGYYTATIVLSDDV